MASSSYSDRELAALENLAARCDAMRNPSAMRRSIREATNLVRDLNRDRIKRNVTPSGDSMQKRKSPQKSLARISFLYRTPDGNRTIRDLRNFREMKHMYIGYDRTRGGVRSFLKSRIIKTISVDKTKVSAKPSQQKMFKRLIRNQWLRTKMTSKEASVYFAGVAGNVAAIHHFGEKDKPNPKSQAVEYPQRELLGFTAEDVDKVEDIFIKHFSL